MSDRNAIITLLQNKLPDIQAALPPNSITAAKLEVAFRAAFNNNPKLLECSQMSIANAIVNCATLGLIPNSPEQHAYLIARKLHRDDPQPSCCLEISYRGFVHLIIRTGDVSKVDLGVIHKGDEYQLQSGQPTICWVKPNIADPERDNQPVLATFSLITFKDGTQKLEVMGAGDLKKIEAAMMRQNFGKMSPAYREWRTEMLKKAPMKRSAKTCNFGSVFAFAAQLDNQALRIEPQEPRAVVLPSGETLTPLPRHEAREEAPESEETQTADLTVGEEESWQ